MEPGLFATRAHPLRGKELRSGPSWARSWRCQREPRSLFCPLALLCQEQEQKLILLTGTVPTGGHQHQTGEFECAA